MSSQRDSVAGLALAAPTGAPTSTEVTHVDETNDEAGPGGSRSDAFGGEQRGQAPQLQGGNDNPIAEMERLVLAEIDAVEAGQEPPEGYTPLFVWPASCRYDEWITTIKSDLRSGRATAEYLSDAINNALEDGSPWPPQENPAGPGPAPHLLRRLKAALGRRGQRETLVPRPRPPQRELAVGRPRPPRPVQSRPPPGQRRQRAHLYAFPLSRAVPPHGPAGPAPPPGASAEALRAWVGRTVRSIGADDEGVAACNEPADALWRGRWAGSAKALERARAGAAVYKAPREPVPSETQPAFAARAFVVCGEYVSSLEALARHAPCFSRRVDVYQACRRHLLGRAPEIEWAQTTRELAASQLCFRRWKESTGGHGPVRCRALPLPKPPPAAPAEPPVTWPRVGPDYVAMRVDPPDSTWAEPDAQADGRVRYQGAALSRLLDCDVSCACVGDCETDHEDQDLRPGERFWTDPTGESRGTRYRYQGAGASLPVVVSASAGDVKVTHSFPQIDLLLQAMAGPGGEYPLARKLTRVAALLVGVGSAGSVLSAASHIASFIAGDEWLFGLMATQVASLTSRLSAGGWRHQGPEDESFFQVASRVVFQSAVLVAVKEASGSVSEGVALAIKEFGKAFKIAAAKKTAEGVLDWVCQALKEFWQRLMSAWEQRSWTPLWGTGSDPRRWAAHARGVIDHHQLLVTAEPRPGGARAAAVADLVEKGQIPPLLARGLTPGQYLAAVEDLRDQGQRFLDGLPPGPLGASIRALTADLAHKAVSVAASIRGATTRPVPYFIYAWGPAGTGKTNLLHAVFKAIGAHAGLPTDDKARWPWQRGVNFQDGLDSSHWAVAFDDVDHVKGTFGVGDELFPAVVTRLVNNEPFPVEAAAVEDKGTRFAAPLLVTQASNFDAEQVAAYSICPEAFWRRVGLHARVEVKPEFRRKGGGQTLAELDPDLCEGRLDIYNIYLGSYRGPGKDGKDSYFVAATEPIGISEFVQLAQKGFAAHQARQHRLLTQRESGELCATCFLPTAVPHGCPAEKKQMYRTGYPAGPGETVLDEDEGDSVDDDDLEPLTEGGRLDPPNWFKRGLFGAYRTWRAVCGFGDETLREVGSCARDACVVGAFRACSCVAAPSCLGCCPAVIRHLADISPRAAAGAVAATMAATMAAQVVEEALGEFPVATAATILAAAGAVYAVYRGGKWLLQARGAGVDTSQWIPVPPVFGPQAPSTPLNATWTRDQVLAAVARSQFPYRTSTATAFALALKPNLLAIPTHLLPAGGEFELDLGVGWQKFPWRPDWSEVSATNRELTFVAVRTRGDAGVAQFLPEVTNMSVMQYDEALLSPGPERPFPGPFRVTRGPRGELAVTGSAGTQDGDCGRSYILRSGRNWWVGAVHYAGLEVGGAVVSAMGCPLSRREVEAVARRLDPGVTTGGPTVIPQGLTVTAAGTPWVLGGPPSGYSEVLTALANGRARKVAYWGTLANGPPGASPRSTLRPTIFAHHFRDLEEKYCGVSPYWGPPVFKGAMVDGVWESPQQHAFDAGLGVLPERATWTVAIMDYLSGIERLDFGELRELSLAEALAGQPELWANPVNPSTSSGLPKNQPKWMQIYRCFQELKLDPELYAIIDEIERLVDSGEIPTPPGAWVLKDEPRKPGGEARLFTVLPAAYNIVLARRLSAVYAQMRAHPEFFECWIGIDMTSPDVERLIRFWRHVCPDLDRMGDADTTKQDKSFSTASWTAVRMVYSAIAHFAGLNRTTVENLVRSQEFVKYIWKGDVFESAQDPSGVKGVIENNSIDCSVTMRFAYYAARPDVVAAIPWEAWLERFPIDPTVPPGLPLTFRRDCANAQFGDDNAHALAPGVPNFVRPDLLLRERGILVTSGDKSGVVRQGPLSTITFLKREFKFDSELGYHLAALAPKSILKTALVRMRTSLSDADHAALALTQVVREAVFHGPDFFEEISSRARAAAQECGLVGHRLLRIHTYENYRERLRRGVFSVYKDIGEVGSDAYFAVDGAGLIRADQLPLEE